MAAAMLRRRNWPWIAARGQLYGFTKIALNILGYGMEARQTYS
jgi:hypothetical protein